MRIDAYLTPFLTETDTLFNDKIVVMIDVLRASTTVCSALFNGAKEVIPSESPDKAVHIYSGLSKESRFIGGERNGIKPSGFDAGNSPTEYSEQFVKGKTVIITTSNGTKIFQKAKQAQQRIIGAFVNLSVVLEHLNRFINDNNGKEVSLSFLCAGTNGRISYEDTLCAGAFINSLSDSNEDFILTDSAMHAKDLFQLHAENMKEFLRSREHAIYLQDLGFENDIEISLTYDFYPVVPIITGSSIKKLEDITV